MNSAEWTDAEWASQVARAQAGDEAALVELFHAMHPHVIRLVQANQPARESVEDLVQQACIKIVTNLRQFSGRAPFLHWVSRVTINTCLNRMRHEKHRPEVRLADLSEDEAGVVERLAAAPGELDASERVAAGELVDKLLALLKPPDRLLMRLLYLEGRTVEEISGLTGWGQAKIKVRAFRARIQLRKSYARLTGEHP